MAVDGRLDFIEKEMYVLDPSLEVGNLIRLTLPIERGWRDR